MQTDKTKKIYIVKDLKSSCIEQAIFILKTDCKTADLALEAQKIINDYSQRLYFCPDNTYSKTKRKTLFKSAGRICFFLSAIFILKLIFF